MATKKKERQHLVAKKQTPKITGSGNSKYYVPLFFIVLISFIVYMPSLKGSFVWDDEGYLKINTLIHTINLKEIFSTNVMGNYHPLTMLVYCIEYHFFGLNTKVYHTVNLIIHLLNVILVFYAVFHLSNKTSVGLVASLLFGIHPVHVESVAWASELKDLLYTFFFLASYICYLKYLKHSQKKLYFFALLLFLFSLLSKAMAASLPVVLLLTDYFKDRKMNARVWLEKAPFFILALVLGAVAVIAQRSSGATDVDFHSFPQRLVFASYSFITYLLKLIMPFNLMAYYPYPVKSGTSIPLQYYAYPLLFSGLAAYVIHSLRFSKKIFFGVGFFFVTVILVLQLLPVGSAVMADRYSYIPSIGIFYLAGEGFVFLWNKKRATNGLKYSAALALGIAVIFFSIRTYAQCGVWKNGFTLWNDVISQNPSLAMAYHNRGLFFVDQQRDEEAISDFTKAIELNPGYADVYNNRGLRFDNERRYDEALSDYSKAIQLKPGFAKAYANRGNVLYILKRYDEALSDFNKAIQLNPNLAEVYNNRGTVFLTNSKTYDRALADFNKAIEMNPDYVNAYSNRGLLFTNEKKYDEAIKDYSKAIQLQPDFAKAYTNRGIVLNELKRYDEAVSDLNQGISLQPGFADAYNSRGTVLMNEKKYDDAFNDFNKAIELQPDYAMAYFNRGVAEYDSGKKESACSDFQKAMTLGYSYAAGTYNSFCH